LISWSKLIKKLFFYSVIVLINYVLLEIVAYGFFRLKFGDYDRHELQLSRIRTIAAIEQGPVFTADNAKTSNQRIIRKEVIHPYFGYTVDGKKRIKDCETDLIQDCYKRIKGAADKKFPKRTKDRLIVGILGGSVAVGTVRGTSPAGLYEKLLAELPEYKGREVIVYNMAAGGFRQPQQLMTLNYYYALGAEFDILVSLDGFNDVAIPVSVYKDTGTHPSFPRDWVHRVASKVPKELVDLLADKKIVQKAHVSRAKVMSNPWFRNSPLSNLLWNVFNINYLNTVGKVDEGIANLEKRDLSKRDFHYEALGPDYDFTTWENLFQYSVDMWATSSHLIYGIAEVNNAKYFHFLQPNQYIEGSKLFMNEAETNMAFMAQGGYGNLYKRIYPLIQEKTSWIKERGIQFHDLTYIYKDVRGHIYVDNCCHVSIGGYNLMVEKIVETIHQSNLANEAQSQ